MGDLLRKLQQQTSKYLNGTRISLRGCVRPFVRNVLHPSSSLSPSILHQSIPRRSTPYSVFTFSAHQPLTPYLIRSPSPAYGRPVVTGWSVIRVDFVHLLNESVSLFFQLLFRAILSRVQPFALRVVDGLWRGTPVLGVLRRITS